MHTAVPTERDGTAGPLELHRSVRLREVLVFYLVWWGLFQLGLLVILTVSGQEFTVMRLCVPPPVIALLVVLVVVGVTAAYTSGYTYRWADGRLVVERYGRRRHDISMAEIASVWPMASRGTVIVTLRSGTAVRLLLGSPDAVAAWTAALQHAVERHGPAAAAGTASRGILEFTTGRYLCEESLSMLLRAGLCAFVFVAVSWIFKRQLPGTGTAALRIVFVFMGLAALYNAVVVLLYAGYRYRLGSDALVIRRGKDVRATLAYGEIARVVALPSAVVVRTREGKEYRLGGLRAA